MTTLEIILLALAIWFYLAGTLYAWSVIEPVSPFDVVQVITWPVSILVLICLSLYAHFKDMLEFRH